MVTFGRRTILWPNRKTMMTNKEIAGWFRKLADIMELHGENPFKIRSYQSAYVTLRKWGEPLADLSLDQLNEISGIGKAISEKIRELVETGTLATYQKYADQTPEGVVELLDVPGIGPKKVRLLWKELGVESLGELLYACNENRLIELKGFGVKTQEDLQAKLAFYLQNKGQMRYPDALQVAREVLMELEALAPGARVELTGELRRGCQVISEIAMLWNPPATMDLAGLPGFKREEESWWYLREDHPAVRVFTASLDQWGEQLWLTTGTPAYVRSFPVTARTAAEESDFMRANDLPLHLPEWRESREWAEAAAGRPGELIDVHHIRGMIHAHSKWSDGVHTVEEMALAARSAGAEYLVMTDHSQSAFYANGLKPDRVVAQRKEIEALNRQLAPFRIFHGIESDILYSGELDYEEDVLSSFDVVIASVHSQLKMDEDRAMTRLLGAIQNRHTRILGHPTGRLLLSRSGYPVDHRKLIEACAEHGVAIELNANPARLDLDYTWLPYAMECGVLVAINPDAHSMAGIQDVQYGVQVARKAGLRVDNCLNTMDIGRFLEWISD